MSGQKNKATSDLNAEIGIRRAIDNAESMQSAPSTEEYLSAGPSPQPAPAPAMIPPVNIPRLQLEDVNRARAEQMEWEDQVARMRASIPARVAAERADRANRLVEQGNAARFLAANPDLPRDMRFAYRSGKGYLVSRVLPPADPLIATLATNQNDVQQKIQALYPSLTPKQRMMIQKRWTSITTVMKGKPEKRGQPKLPSNAQLNKVLFMAHEFHAKRRAAQFAAQARRAAKERHSLVQHGRVLVGVAAGGEVVKLGVNKRAYKKIATNNLRKLHLSAGQAEAKAVRLDLTNRYKAERVEIARRLNRKVNPKDLLPATK